MLLGVIIGCSIGIRLLVDLCCRWKICVMICLLLCELVVFMFVGELCNLVLVFGMILVKLLFLIIV